MVEPTGIANKRKHMDEPPVPNGAAKVSRELPYLLNKVRALQKRLDSTMQDNNV